MRQNIFDFRTAPVEILYGVSVFLTIRDLLRPPVLSWLPQLAINRGGAAEDKKGVPLNREDLPPHQMKDVSADAVNLPAAPLLHRKLIDQRKVFMDPVHKDNIEGQLFQPIQESVGIAVPEKQIAKITCERKSIITGQPCHFRNGFPGTGKKDFLAPVRISLYTQHDNPPLSI